MVETWEIEWNSSMIEHGVDLGTMEFIFAKGGNLSDVNYVMLNQHDDTWEPLIKAVAERDNSHPDIIRKNVDPQQPYGVNPQFRPAIPMNVAGTNTAVQSARQARRLLGAQRTLDSQEALNQGQRTVGNLARTGQYGQAAGRAVAQAGRGIAEGAKGIGRGVAGAGRFIGSKAGQAGRFLADKFPGASERMRDFMGVAGNYREGRRQAKEQARQDKKAGMRRDVLQGELNTLADQRERARREAGTDAGERHRQLVAIAQTPLAQQEEAKRQEMAEKISSLEGPRPNRFRRALDISRQKRGLQQTPEQMEAAQQANEGTVQEISEQVDSASPEIVESVNTDTPPPPAVTPQPVEAEQTFDVGPPTEPQPEQTFDVGPPTEPQPEQTFDVGPAEPATSERDADLMGRIQSFLGEGEKPYTKFGGTSAGQQLSERMYDAGFDPASEEEYAQEMIDAMGIKGGAHGNALKNRLMQSSRFKAAVAAGDEQAAQQVAEEEAQVMFPDSAGDGDDEGSSAAPLDVTFSSDKHTASWDALLKGLNIR